MAELKLSNGGVTLVDDDWVWRLARFTWFKYAMSSGVYVKARVTPGRAGKHIALHRYIMRPPAGYVVDHINGDTLDNRTCNLQIVTQSRNAMKGKLAMNGGVCFEKSQNRWRVTIRIDGKRHYLGRFKTREAAQAALDLRRAEAWNGPENILGAIAHAE